MHWALAIDRNRRALFGLVAAILALLRVRSGAALPRRRFFCAALTLLRAAAAAGPRSDVPERAARLIQRLQVLAHAPAQLFDEAQTTPAQGRVVDFRCGRLLVGRETTPLGLVRFACAPDTS